MNTYFMNQYFVIWLPPWSSCQGSWLQIRRSGFDSRRYQIFWEVVGLEWGPLSLLSTTEELFERESSGSGLEIREYGRMDPSRWPNGTLYPQKLAITLPTSGGRSVGIVRSRTQATEIVNGWFWSFSEQVSISVALQTCVRGKSGLNLVSATTYRDRSFRGFRKTLQGILG
jgi:hypothetical protein